MPRSKNPSMYPSFFHDVARRVMAEPIRVPGGPGPSGKAKAEKYRFNYYGFREALKRYHQMDAYSLACGIQILLRYDQDTAGEKHWYILFQNRDEDPFFDDFKEAMKDIGEPESAALPPGESYQFQPIDVEDLRTERELGRANVPISSEPAAVAQKELERTEPALPQTVAEVAPVKPKPPPKTMRYKT